MSPMKTIVNSDRPGYGNKKFKKYQKRLVGFIAAACDVQEKLLAQLDRLTKLFKTKQTITWHDKPQVLFYFYQHWYFCNDKVNPIWQNL